MQMLYGDPAHVQRVTGLNACRTMLPASSLAGVGMHQPLTCTASLGGRRWHQGEHLLNRNLFLDVSRAVLHSVWLLNLCTTIHLHNTRSAAAGGIHVPKARTGFGKKSFTFRGCQRWNALPPFIRTIKNFYDHCTIPFANLYDLI